MNWFLSFFQFFYSYILRQLIFCSFLTCWDINLISGNMLSIIQSLQYLHKLFWKNEFYLKLLIMTLTDIYYTDGFITTAHAFKIMIIQTLGLCLISSRFARAWSVKLNNFVLACFLGSKESGNWYYALVLFFRTRWFSKSDPRYFLCFYA